MSGDARTHRMQKALTFWTELFEKAEAAGLNIPHADMDPRPKEILDSPAARGIVYRLRVTKENSRIVLTNKRGSRLGVYDYLLENRNEIDKRFRQGNGTSRPLDWCDNRTGQLDPKRSERWWIRYVVDGGSEDQTRWHAAMPELNEASVVLRNIFQPYLNRLTE